jgi:AcrR family transcriptional regulator
MARGDAREALLTAAVALFGERGYDRTTTRDLAERAGVDATLIARYFGSKAGLYLAALRVELGDGPPPDLLEPDRMTGLLGRIDARGPGPVFHSAVRAHDDEAVQAAAREALQARLVTPLRERYARAGLSQPQLRAELAVAAFTGVLLGRGSGAFPELESASATELVALLTDLLGS